MDFEEVFLGHDQAVGFKQLVWHKGIGDAGFIFQSHKTMAAGGAWSLAADDHTCDGHPDRPFVLKPDFSGPWRTKPLQRQTVGLGRGEPFQEQVVCPKTAGPQKNQADESAKAGRDRLCLALARLPKLTGFQRTCQDRASLAQRKPFLGKFVLVIPHVLSNILT